MKLSRDGALLIAVCVADLVTTIWFVNGYGAQEANPLMSPFLEMGVVPFILAKAMFCLAPLALIEWARSKNPFFVRYALRTGIALYLGFYATGVWKINRVPSDEITYTAAEMAAIREYAGRPATDEQLKEFRIQMARE